MACCPDGQDCRPLYGDRNYCSCSKQPAGFANFKYCKPYQTPGLTAVHPTMCETTP